MKPNYTKLLGVCLALAWGTIAYSQTETEPNNTTATADTVSESVVMSGDVSNADLNDYFYTVLPDDGTLKLKFDYTGTDAANQTDFNVDVRNKNNSVIGTYSRANLINGTAHTDSIMVHCRAADTVYFRFNIGAASGAASYDMTYSVAVPGPNDAEPNDVLADANETFEAVSYPGRLGYTSISQDLTDNYYTVLPDDGTLTLKFNYTAYTSTATTDIRVRVLNKAGTQIGTFQRNNLEPDSTYSDSVVVTCRAADTVYFEFYNFAASGCYAYNFEYAQTVHGPNDPEPNDDLTSASEVLENTNYPGRLGNTSISQDIVDNYYTILPDDGTLVLKFNYTAHADGNTTDMRVRVLNKNGGEIGNFSRNNLALDTTYSDSVIVYCRAADTVYFEFYNFTASGCYVYDFEYEQIIHGPNDPEPNDDLTSASEVFEATNYAGRLGNVSINQDIVDNYYTILPDDGTLVLRFNYTAHSAGNTTDMRVRVLNKNGFQIAIFSESNLALDSNYSDSIVVHCRAADTVYFEFYNFMASGCYVYDFEYEQIIHGPNDPEPNDDLTQASEVFEATNYAGRLGNVSIEQDIVDNYYTVLPDDGTLVLNFNYTSHYSANSTDMRVRVLNKNGTQIGFFQRSNLMLDTTYSDSLIVYCRAADTVYFEFYNFTGSGCYVYDFDYEIKRPLFGYDQEPNDDFASAQLQTIGTAAPGHAGYASVAADVNDYHMYILPEDGQLKIDLDYRANLNNSSSDLFLYAFASGQQQRFFTSFTNVQDDTTFSTTIDLYCLAKDTMYFRVYALSGCFDYEINTTFIPSSQGTDPEPNNSFAEATPIGLLDTTYGANGHIGNAVDGIDYFSFYNSGYREIDLIYQLRRTGDPINQNGVYQVRLFDENKNPIGLKQYLNSVPNDSLVTDTFTLDCPPLDTFYVSFSSSLSCIGYNIRFDLENGTYYADADMDGFGDIDSSTYSCVGIPPGFVINNQDCDDTDSTVNPAATEICDGKDNNCDGNIDEGIYTTSISNVALCEGDSVLIGGMYQMMAGTYIDTTIIVDGCDSISTVTVTVNPADTTYLTGTTCDSTQAGMSTTTFTNQYGCDSVVIQTITYDPGDETVLTPLEICEGQREFFFSNYYDRTGTYYDTLQNGNGCDSVLVQQLIVNPADTTYLTMTTGDPGMNGQVDTTYLSNQYFCDSLIITTKVYVSGCTKDTVYRSSTTCDSTEDGVFTTTLTNQGGCDSVIIDTIVLDPGSRTQLPAMSICDGDSLLVFGQWQSMAGVYYDTLQNVNGCDSILIKQLLVNPTYSSTLPGMSICQGDSMLIFGMWQSASGTYYDSLQTANGCDSIVSKTLTVDAVINTTGAMQVCDGDSVLIFGMYQSMAGMYSDTNPSAAGCDSIHTVTLNVLPTSSGAATAMICDGDSTFVGGAWQTMAGTYYDILTAANGCDSTVATSVTVKPTVTVTTTDSICEGDSVLIGGMYQSMPGSYPVVYTGGNSCDSTLVTILYYKDSADCAEDTAAVSLVCVSDASWMKSTIVTPTNLSGSWGGVNGNLPATATFTLPAMVGQPYPWPHLFLVDGADPIKTESDITYFRKEFTVGSNSDLEARIRMTVDDQSEVYINGQLVVRIDDFGRICYKAPGHDALFESGTVTNPYSGGDAYGYATGMSLGSIVQPGTNELIVVVRNLGKSNDRGGFSFRMDLGSSGSPVPKSALAGVNGFGLLVYPNPAKDYVIVSLAKATPAEAKLMLYDFSGKLLHTESMTNSTELDLSRFSQGVYLVKVISGEQTYTQKVVRE